MPLFYTHGTIFCGNVVEAVGVRMIAHVQRRSQLHKRALLLPLRCWIKLPVSVSAPDICLETVYISLKFSGSLNDKLPKYRANASSQVMVWRKQKPVMWRCGYEVKLQQCTDQYYPAEVSAKE